MTDNYMGPQVPSEMFLWEDHKVQGIKSGLASRKSPPLSGLPLVLKKEISGLQLPQSFLPAKTSLSFPSLVSMIPKMTTLSNTGQHRVISSVNQNLWVGKK